jgi:glucose/arabinose dehydrogenase
MKLMHTLLLSLTTASLAACGPEPIDPQKQIGANPYLPPIHQYLLPPMHVAKVVGWNGQMPKVTAGLKIEALATDLKNPRSLYVLPNGDVLVVEADGPKAPINRPKEFIMSWIEKKAHSSTKAGNRILLIRRGEPGQPAVKSVFIDHLNSPFGVVLVGNDLYVANTDSVMRFPYQTGETQITAPGTKLCDLPGGPIDHHWTKSLTANEDGTKLYAGVGSNSNITENGIGAEANRAAIWEIDRATGAHRLFATGLRNPNGLQFEPQTHTLWAVVNERDELGPDLVPDYMTSVKDGAFYGWPYSYYGQHVDPRVQPRSSASMAVGIGRRSMATRSCMCLSKPGILMERPRTSSRVSSETITTFTVARSAWLSTNKAAF